MTLSMGSPGTASAHMVLMATATDARGATIRVGDVVTYVTGGRYPQIMTAEVLDIKAKVKLGHKDVLNRDRDGAAPTWVYGDRAIVVSSLPFVAGRQNTADHG